MIVCRIVANFRANAEMLVPLDRACEIPSSVSNVRKTRYGELQNCRRTFWRCLAWAALPLIATNAIFPSMDPDIPHCRQWLDPGRASFPPLGRVALSQARNIGTLSSQCRL